MQPLKIKIIKINFLRIQCRNQQDLQTAVFLRSEERRVG